MIKTWIQAAGMRCLRTVAQAALGFIGTALIMGEVDWLRCGSTALLAGIVSLLMSLAGLPEIKAEQQLKALTDDDAE